MAAGKMLTVVLAYNLVDLWILVFSAFYRFSLFFFWVSHTLKIDIYI